MYQLNNKVAIVTGSGRHKGIGEAIVLRLAAEGCRVVISDIGQPKGNEFSAQHIGVSEEMQQIANACRALGAEVLTIPCDVRIENECQQLMSWDAVLDVNLKGAFLCSKHAAIQMIQQGNGGSIINIASQAAKSGFPFAAAYTASKHGLVGLTRSNAVELGKHKIRVNAVCPNHITTGLGHWQNSFFSEKLGMDYATYLQSIVQKNPLGRTGLTEDIAKAVAFLCSEESAYITGEAMNVSGGEEYH